MQLCIIFITLNVALVTHASLLDAPKAKGLDFIGIGYDLLKGNPDGETNKPGLDPGLKKTRKIFNLTWANKIEGSYQVPKEVTFLYDASCIKSSKREIITGTKSYQESLRADVSVSGGYEGGLWSASFSASSRYKDMEEETSTKNKLFFEERSICINGTGRYRYGVAEKEGYSVTKDFAEAVCRLPIEYSENDYRIFVGKWGTHIVDEVTLGTKRITRHESSYMKVANYAMKNIGGSLSAEASYGGGSGSVSVDVDWAKNTSKDTSEFTEKKVEITSGGNSLNVPIKIALLPIDMAMHKYFFSPLPREYQCDDEKYEERRNNLNKFFEDYPRLLKITDPKDRNVTLELVWPRGTYGLPMPKSGCPTRGAWNKGTRYQDTEDDNTKNYVSSPYDLAGGKLRNGDMEQKFCMRTLNKVTDYELDWPIGKYCIFKKGDKCPSEDFEEGSIKWDDEDSNNRNKVSGSLPEGEYGGSTKIQYCCRTDGMAPNPIFLPTDSPFVLFPFSHECQQVHGMRVRTEYFKFDCEDDNNKNKLERKHPYVEDRSDGDIKLYYCYYYK